MGKFRRASELSFAKAAPLHPPELMDEEHLPIKPRMWNDSPSPSLSSKSPQSYISGATSQQGAQNSINAPSDTKDTGPSLEMPTIIRSKSDSGISNHPAFGFQKLKPIKSNLPGRNRNLLLLVVLLIVLVGGGIFAGWLLLSRVQIPVEPKE